jgi:hypothetical protein
MAARFKTTAKGQQVVCGTVDEVQVGQVTVDTGCPEFPTLSTVEVVSLGKPFPGLSCQLVYGYLTAAPTQPVPATPARVRTQAPTTRSQGRGWAVRDESTGKVYQPRRGANRACVTGGQCSSFGTGRSCGGHDCDGH